MRLLSRFRKCVGYEIVILLMASFLLVPMLNVISVAYAANPLTPKWTATGVPFASVGALVADVTGDSNQEVIQAGEGGVAIVNGVTGSVIRAISVSGATSASQFECADLDNDGKFEIVVASETPARLYAFRGDGSSYWTSPVLGGTSPSNPVIADIDGGGVPTVFVATMWTASSNNDGKLTALNGRTGAILRQVWSWHSCAGGLSIADADNDGRFELYLGDRPNNYGDGNLGRGLVSYWADDLSERWALPEILCSSNRPMLADVNNDGILDVIIGYHRGGLAVVNSQTGSYIYNGLNLGSVKAPVHYQPSVYDIDGDGHLEMLMADAEHYINNKPVVFDLVTHTVDATLDCDPGKFGPEVADVTGDGKMDIIVANNNGIYIYNSTYVLLQAVTGLRYRLFNPVVADIDGDGLNELIVAQGNDGVGRIYAYDTPAPTPIPRPRTEFHFYSERRNGVQEYVPPPGRVEPAIKDPSPSDGEIDVPIALSQLGFTLSDFQGDLMDYTVTTTPNIGSGSGTDVGNGRYSVDVSGLDYGKTYSWTIEVTDGSHVTNETYAFTTKEMPLWWNTNWQYRRAINIDPSQVSGDQTDFPVVVDTTDSNLIGKVQLDGDDILFVDLDNAKLSHEIEQYDSSTGHLVAWVRIPFISSTSFTTFYMYYGNPAATNQEDPAAVWDTGYKLVLHLSETHECRMWGMVSDSLPHDVVVDHLIDDTNSLEKLSPSNPNGWGLVWYAGTVPEIRRGFPTAINDPNYDPAVEEMASSGATTAVAHIRAAASGGIPSTGNPHPFMRFKNGKWWAFSHNGVLNKANLKTLIGAAYLAENPPIFGTNWDDSNVIDTDLYELYVLKCIEQSNWDVLTGIAKAVSDITASDGGAANFLLTDGVTLWGFRKGNTLSYFYQSTAPRYSVVASQPPDPTQAGWTSMSDYSLVILTRNNAPYLISDIRQFKLLTDSTFDASADSAALLANATVQDWYESRNDVPTLLYLDTTNVGGNAGKKAGFTASSSGNAYLSQEFGVPQTGVFSVQWDIYVDSILAISGTDRAGWMMIGDDFNSASGPNQPSSERFVYLAFFKDGGGTSGTMDLVAKNSTGDFALHTVIASGLNLRQWYTVKVIVDVAAKTYDVYVDGVFIAKVGSAFARTSVTHISFAQWNDGAGAFYVDNVLAPAPISSHTLTLDVVGSGTVSKNPDLTTYSYGSSVTITAAPSAGWAFSGWTGDFVGSANPATITMDSNKVITATFVGDVYTLTVNVVGSGSVTENPDLPTYNYGDEVALTANPNAGYKFVVWSGDLSGTANPATITMTGNKVVTATFYTEDTSVCIDSSIYGDIGTLYGDVTQGASGKIDGAYAFDGINDYVRFAHRSTLAGYTDSFTASFWLKLSDVSKRQAILNKYDTAGNQRGWYIEFQTHATYGKVLNFFASQDGVNYREWYTSFSPTAGTWYYITVVWQSNTVPKFYINGAQVATIGTGTIASIYNNPNTPLYIGRSYTTGRYLAGVLDEVRLSSPARSAGYTLTSYNNQKNPGLFCQVGPEQSLPATPIISNPYPANGATDAPVALSTLSFNLADYQNDLLDYTVTTSPDIGTGSGTDVSPGTHSISVTGLEYGTTYTWEVWATDGTHSTTATYTFTTIPQFLVDSELVDSTNSDDLRTNSPEQDWYESRAQVPTLLYLDETNIGDNTGKKAGFTASSSGNAYLTQEFAFAQTGTFSVQWDIYVDSILDLASNPDRAGFMLIGADLDASGGPNRNDNERFVFLGFYKDGGATSGAAGLVAMSTFTTFTTVASVNLDQWYTIKVVVNVPAGTYDVYVDGVYKATKNAATALSSVTHISFAQWNDGAGAFYVDNVYSPAVDMYSLSISTVGSGTVEANPMQATYTAGSVVVLTAVPEIGWSFDGWSGDLTGTTNPAAIIMDGNKVVTATFSTGYSLTVNTVGSGSVVKNPDKTTYPVGSEVVLTAVPEIGWSFDGWSGDLTGTTNPAAIIMDGNKVVTATFTQDQYTLTVDVEGGGSVTKTPDQPTYTYGTIVQLTATPEPGYAFSHWTGDISGSLNPESVSMTGNKAVTAVFVWTQTNWWNTSWQYRRTITIDHTKVSADQTDFPILIDLTDSGLTLKAQTDGDDFVFTDANQVKLSHEIELYESSTGHLVAWVKIPLLSSTTDNILYMYYQNPSSPNQQDTTAVWDSSNKLVLHFDEKTGLHYDSTVNGNNGTPYNGVTQGASGKIDGADTLDGVNDYIQVAHSSTLTGYTASFTTGFWLRLDDVSRRQAILNKYDTAGNQRGWYIEFQNHATYGKVLDFFVSQNGVTWREYYASFSPAAGTWYYITVVWQSNTVPRFYINGAQVATIGTGTIASIFNNAGTPLYIGRSYTTGRYLLGSLDEIRISNPVRSASWILTSYNSQSNPSTFCQMGTEEQQEPEPPRYTLTINLVGQGSVTKDPSKSTYLQDTVVQLTANADPGWTFDSWSGDLSGNTNPTSITMDGNKAVTATFTQNQFTITASAGAGGSISPSGAVTVDYGATPSFTIAPDTGYNILDVKVDSVSVLGDLVDGVYTFSAVEADHEITASFSVIPVTWTITASAGVGGSIDPVGAVVVNDGEDQSFTITADTGYAIADVLVDGLSVGAVSVYPFADVVANHTIEASFELAPLLVDAEFDDSTDSADLRTNNATAQDWYESRAQVPTLLFLDGTNVGGNAGKKAGFTASASGNAYLTQELSSAQTGTFSVQYDIYVDSILDISGNPDRSGIMMLGSTSASYGPNRNDVVRFVFLAFYKDGGATSGTADLVAMTAFGTFTTVASGLNLDQWYTIRVVVNVAAKTYEVYVDGVSKGSYAAVTAWAQPAITHISFAQWNDGAGAFYVDNVFAPAVDRYKLTVNLDGSGTVAVDPAESSYASGAEVTLTATPGSGWLFSQWTGDLTGSTNPATITMTGNKVVTATFIRLLVDSEFSDSADSADLRANNATAQDWYESRAQVPTLLFLDGTNVGGNAGKKAGFTASASGNAYLTQEFSSAQTGVSSVQYDIYVDSILDISGNPDRSGVMMLGSTSATYGPNRNDAVRFAFLAFYKDGGATSGTADLVAMTSFSAFTTVASGLNLDQWYTIKVIANVTAKTYEVYVDGVYKGSFAAVTAWAQPAVTHISFAQWNDGAGSFYVDNVFSPAVERYRLTLNVEGTGTIDAIPSESSYAKNTVVSLTPNPGTGYTFDHWTLNGVPDGSAVPYSVTMDNYKTVTAIFAKLNEAPVISSPEPSDTATGVSISTSMLNFTISDSDGELMTYYLSTLPDVGSGSQTNVGDGIYSLAVTGLAYETTYTWWINVTDGPHWTNVSYTFTTEGLNAAPEVSNPEPANGATGVLISTSLLNFTIGDTDGDLMDCYVSTTPNIGSGSQTGLSDGTYSLAVSGLSYGTTYQWWINVTDGTNWTNKSYAFTTPPLLLVDSAFDASVDNATLIANGVGQDWYESRNQYPALLFLDETDIGGNTGKKAGFTGNSSSNAYLTQEFSSPQTEVFSVQWDIYVDSIITPSGSNPYRAGWMLIGDDSTSGNGPNAANGERFVYMAFNKTGGGTSGIMDLVAIDRTGSFANHRIVASGLNLKQWYTIKVICNLTSDTYDVYVDGVFKATVTSRVVKTSVTHISFAQWNDGAGTFYVDNVFAPSIDTYKLTVSSDGNGSVTIDPGESSYVFGTVVSLTPIADSGYVFDHWEINGISVGSDVPYLVTMDSNKAVTAFFSSL